MANILYGEKPIISLIFRLILSLQFDDVNTILLFFYAADGKKAVSEPNSDTAGVNIAYSASISP